MSKISQRPVAKTDQPIGATLVDRISWDDLKLFIAVARTLSFRRAATSTRISSSTLVRRIERLEDELGLRLFDRLPDGVGLTAEGQSIYSVAQEMERASHSLRAYLDQDLTTRGVVRCAITEGLGTFWILPHLAEFTRGNPFTIVDLRASMESADVLRMQADAAIQLIRPDHADLKVLRLGRLHIYPFASRRYADTYGLPRSVEEMKRHRLVDQTAPQLDEGAWPRLLGLDNVEGIVSLRTNASTAHFYAVEQGIGIGGLPTYAAALGADVVPVDIGIKHQTDIWLTYHPHAKTVKRVSIFIDWVRSLFDAKRYPWFRDEFIHPRDLAKADTPARSDRATRRYVATSPKNGAVASIDPPQPADETSRPIRLNGRSAANG
ncbi:MAG TPA: LysR family transcriptional regulator [Pseudolabrys sp.]|jgi:DNA-binding transcriptional LysR family regulator|nr:LysR family transcriptional regulator [Pseudolabrys sp.]